MPVFMRTRATPQLAHTRAVAPMTMPISPESVSPLRRPAAPPAPARRGGPRRPARAHRLRAHARLDRRGGRRAPARLRLRRRRAHGDGLPRGPGAARRGARRRLHGAGRPAARLGAPRARPRAAGPRLRPRADGPRLRARGARPGSASTSTAAATRARSPSSRARCGSAIPGLRIVGGHCPPFRPLTDAEEDARSRTTSTAPAPTSSGSGSACRSRRSGWRGCATGSTRRCSSASAPRSTSTRASSRRRRTRCSALGLEWVFRLAQEPRRLWRRYLRYNPRFVLGFARQYARHLAEPAAREAARALAILVAVVRWAGPRPPRPTSTTTTPPPPRAAPGDMVVVGRGADGAIYERHLAGGAWTPGRRSAGPRPRAPRPPRTATRSTSSCSGTDGAVYQNVLRERARGRAGASLGGGATSAPAALARRGTICSTSPCAATDNAIYHRYVPARGGLVGLGVARRQPDERRRRSTRRTRRAQRLVARDRRAARPARMERTGVERLDAARRRDDRRAVGRLAAGRTTSTCSSRGTDRALYQQLLARGDRLGRLDAARPRAARLHARGRRRHGPATSCCSPAAAAGSRSRSGGPRRLDGWADWGPGRAAAAPAPPPPPPPRRERRRSDRRALHAARRPAAVSLKIRKRAGTPAPRVRRVVFFVKHGPRRVDRRRPWVQPAAAQPPGRARRGRVFARALHPQGIAAAAPQDGVQALRDVRLG